MSNQDKVIFVHIPKCGGTYVTNVLYGVDKVTAIHNNIYKYQISNKQILTTIRHPLNFYNSFYNFLKYPNHPIKNPMQYIVKTYDDINTFTTNLLNKTLDLNKPFNIFDAFYMKSPNKYGLLTNYILYFFGYNGDHSKENIYNFIKNLKNRVKFMRIEDNLSEQLVEFSKDNDIQLYEQFLDKKINANTKNQLIDDPILKKLIHKKDKPVFEIFDYKFDEYT